MSEHPATVPGARGYPVSIPGGEMGRTGMTVAWRELRRAAVSAARRGWPVVPGTYLGADRHWHGRDTARRLCPISDIWQNAPVIDPDHAEEIWTWEPYGVLLVCGRGVDVLELPHRMCELLPAPEVPQVPVAATGPPPRWLLFTATGSGSLSCDLNLARVRLREAGAWVALPPTPVADMFTTRWTKPPQHDTTRLPTADEVQHALFNALLRSGLGTGSDDGDGEW